MSRSNLRLVYRSQSPEDTVALGRALGEALGNGALVCLSGPLGAGKTCLAQGIALGLGVSEDAYVSSPSFVVINEYSARVPVYHVDLFRVDGAREVEDLGLLEHLEGPGVVIIEWPERAAGLLPVDRVDVSLRICSEQGREVVLEFAPGLGALANRMADALESLAERHPHEGCG